MLNAANLNQIAQFCPALLVLLLVGRDPEQNGCVLLRGEQRLPALLLGLRRHVGASKG